MALQLQRNPWTLVWQRKLVILWWECTSFQLQSHIYYSPHYESMWWSWRIHDYDRESIIDNHVSVGQSVLMDWYPGFVSWLSLPQSFNMSLWSIDVSTNYLDHFCDVFIVCGTKDVEPFILISAYDFDCFGWTQEQAQILRTGSAFLELLKTWYSRAATATKRHYLMSTFIRKSSCMKTSPEGSFDDISWHLTEIPVIWQYFIICPMFP